MATTCNTIRASASHARAFRLRFSVRAPILTRIASEARRGRGSSRYRVGGGGGGGGGAPAGGGGGCVGPCNGAGVPLGGGGGGGGEPTGGGGTFGGRRAAGWQR